MSEIPVTGLSNNLDYPITFNLEKLRIGMLSAIYFTGCKFMQKLLNSKFTRELLQYIGTTFECIPALDASGLLFFQKRKKHIYFKL